MQYAENTLTQVIARVDFAGPLNFPAEPTPAFLETIRREFPIVEPRGMHMTEFKLDGDKVITQQESRQLVEWNFHGRSRESHLRIGPDFAAVTLERYDRFATLRRVFETALMAMHDEAPHPTVRRLGLRYINNIKGTRGALTSGWSGLISSQLTAILKSTLGEARPVRLVGIATQDYGDFLVQTRYGVPNPDYPAPIRRKSFLLDFDAFTEAAVPFGELLPLLDSMHGAIDDLFELSIGSKLRDQMGRVDV